MRNHRKSFILIMIFIAVYSSCAPEKDRNIFQDGAKYYYKVSKFNSNDIVDKDTIVMRVKGGYIKEGLFDQIPVEWFHPGEKEDSKVETYITDNVDGVTIRFPHTMKQWGLSPVIPHPQVAFPLEEIEHWSILRKNSPDELNFDSVKHLFQKKGKSKCQGILNKNIECWHITGKNVSQLETHGKWVLEAWFHKEIGFVKWLYDKLGEDYTLTFELIDYENPSKRSA